MHAAAAPWHPAASPLVSISRSPDLQLSIGPASKRAALFRQRFGGQPGAVLRLKMAAVRGAGPTDYVAYLAATYHLGGQVRGAREPREGGTSLCCAPRSQRCPLTAHSHREMTQGHRQMLPPRCAICGARVVPAALLPLPPLACCSLPIRDAQQPSFLCMYPPSSRRAGQMWIVRCRRRASKPRLATRWRQHPAGSA